MFSVNIPYKGVVYSARFPWKIGIVSFMLYPEMMAGKGDIVANLRKLAEDPFFDGIEICALTDDQWSKVKPFLKDKKVARGLQPDLLSRKPEVDLNSSDAGSRREAIDLAKKEIEIVAERGIKNIALCSGPDPGPSKREQAKGLLVGSLVEICAYAQKRGINVVIEPFDREWDKKLLIGPLADAIDVIKEVRKKQSNFGLLWELSHAPLLEERVDDLDKAGDLLTHVHFGCGKRVDDQYLDSHPVFYMKGAVNGVEEVTDLLRKLLNVGYDGMISFEVKPEEGQDVEGVLAMSKGVLVTAYTRVATEILKGRK